MKTEATHLLTSIEAADLLRLTPSQVSRLARRGELPRVVFPNREVRFDPRDLADFVRAHSRSAKKGAAS